MKSDPKSEKCKECYERIRKYKSVLLFCEVMGYCKKGVDMKEIIYKQDAINVVHHSIFDFFDVVEDDEESSITEKDKMLLELNKAICNNIKELPFAQRKGKWIDVNSDGSLWRCNQCKDTACCKGDYCPNCGALMVRGGEDD